MNTSRALAHRFIMANRAAALATADKTGVPHVAPVYCIVDENLALYFSTRVEGSKYVNLINHPTVAMAFINEEKLTAIQLTGTAERIENIQLEQDILHKLMTLRHQDPYWPLPTMQLFERGATNELAIIKVVPTEMTYANFENTGSKPKQFFQKIL